MSKLKLVSWNVNGIRACLKKGLLDVIKELDADIICLQEIKAKVEQLPKELLDIPGYHLYYFPAERPGYSGTAVFSRIEPQQVSFGMGEPRFDCEGRTVIAEYEDFILYNGYFPNGGNGPERLQYNLDFYEYMLEWAKGCTKPLIICGDVNTAHMESDLARPKENEKNTGFLPMERAWITKLLESGFVDTFRLFCAEGGQYSWWDMKTRARERNVGWRIDYFFASESIKDKLVDAYILPDIMGSDHCPVVLEVEF